MFFYRLAAIALGEVERPIVPEEELHRSINRYQGGEDLYKFVHSDDFKRALNGSMEEWMLFLAPHQKLLTLRKFNGSARIKGVAGSGKTVVAIHRLSVLAHNLGSSGKKVIFLTFGSRLPNIAKHLTKRLAGDKISVDELIEFTTFHQWCRRFLVNNHRLVKVDEDRLDGILNHAIHQTRQHFLDLNLWQRPTKFFQDEIQYAIKGRGVSTLEDYLKLDRSGRGTALKDIERRAMFQVSEAYQSQLKQNNLCDFQDWILMALDLLESKAVSFQKYAAAVVDEIQDLTETQMRLVRALVEPGENDLFLVGDGLQRLYAGGYSLRNLGINITGRSAVLIHNYRNTYEIMNTAHSMMSHTPYDDMDEEMEKPIEPILSVRHGEVPSLWCFPTMQEEIAWIGTEIQRLQRECGYREADFALLYRHHQPYKQLITDNLGSKMRLSEVDKSPESFFGDGIKHTTFDSSKGLEFKIVFIVGVTDGVYVPRDEFTYEGTELTEYLERERSRLYVAMTRARDLLYLTYSGGQPSRFLSGIPDTLLHRV